MELSPDFRSAPLHPESKADQEKLYQEIEEAYQQIKASVEPDEKQRQYQKIINSIERWLDLSFEQRLAHPSRSEDSSEIKQKLQEVSSLVEADIKSESEDAIAQSLYGIELRFCRQNVLSAYDWHALTQCQMKLKAITKELSPKFQENLKSLTERCEKLVFTRLKVVKFAERRKVELNLPSALTRKRQISDEREPKHKQRVYSILSIDGGGIRGIIPAKVLVELEKVTSKPISELFNLIGGTSTGGILALGLTTPAENESSRPKYTAQQMLDMYVRDHGEIFKRSDTAQQPNQLDFLKWKEQLKAAINNPRYNNPRAFFDRKLGKATLSQALTDVLITTNHYDYLEGELNGWGDWLLRCAQRMGYAYDIPFVRDMPSFKDEMRKVHYFTKEGLKRIAYNVPDAPSQTLDAYIENWRRGAIAVRDYILNRTFKAKIKEEISESFSLASVARATSAAPTFFPLVKINNQSYLDGGLLQNNPALLCYLESIHSGYRPESLFMLSLGTGKLEKKDYSSIQKIIEDFIFVKAQKVQETEDMFAKDKLLSEGAYHRFQYEFSNDQLPGLDDTTAISSLLEAGAELVEEKQDDIRAIAMFLNPGCV